VLVSHSLAFLRESFPRRQMGVRPQTQLAVGAWAQGTGFKVRRFDHSNVRYAPRVARLSNRA
jgi:hypothetical protein